VPDGGPTRNIVSHSHALWGLSWADVDWHRGTLAVKRQIQDIPGVGSVAGAPKTHSGSRAILLGESTLNELRGQKNRIDAEAKACGIWAENDLIFPSSVGTPFAKTDLPRDFWQLLKAAGLRRIGFHDLRHCSSAFSAAPSSMSFPHIIFEKDELGIVSYNYSLLIRSLQTKIRNWPCQGVFLTTSMIGSRNADPPL